MMFDEDGGRLRPRIAIVREFLNSTGCMDMNPFLESACAQKLQTVFADFADGVESAMKKLSEIAGETLPQVDNERTAEFLASGYVAESLIKRKPVDCILFDAFNRSACPAYLALRDLELEEKTSRGYNPEKVKTAMQGLAGMHTLAKAVPLVYQQLSYATNRVPTAA